LQRPLPNSPKFAVPSGIEPAATILIASAAIGGAQLAKKRKKTKSRSAKESVVALPERLALTTLIDPTSLIGGAGLTGTGQTIPSTPADSTTGGSDPLDGAMNNIGSVAGQAQQTGPGATAQNIGSDGATSSAVAPPTTR
jgi:hypothetical protein